MVGISPPLITPKAGYEKSMIEALVKSMTILDKQDAQVLNRTTELEKSVKMEHEKLKEGTPPRQHEASRRKKRINEKTVGCLLKFCQG